MESDQGMEIKAQVRNSHVVRWICGILGFNVDSSPNTNNSSDGSARCKSERATYKMLQLHIGQSMPPQPRHYHLGIVYHIMIICRLDHCYYYAYNRRGANCEIIRLCAAEVRRGI